MSEVTKEQVSAALQVTTAIADSIRELGSVPSGHLYAFVMTKLSLDQYERIIALLIRSELIAKAGDLLIWKGGVA